MLFGETMENVRKYKDIKLVTTERRRNYLVLEPNYYYTKFFTGSLLAIEMKKTQATINKPLYLGLSILDLRKPALYNFWYNYIKPQYGEKAKSCYMDTDPFIAHVKMEYIYKDISEDVQKRFDTSNYEVDRSFPTGKNKTAPGVMKEELGGNIVKKLVNIIKVA